MQNRPFFSIVTISYNSEETIKRTIQSVADQNFKDYEYLIIDGKSTDNTLNIAREFQDQIDNMHILSEKDTGIYNAMNKGIKKSVGKIVIILNSDDWLEKDCLEKLYQLYEDDNTIITGALNFWTDNTHYVKYHSTIKRFNKLQKQHLSPIRHPATFVPLNVYKRIGVFDENFKIIGDTDFIYRCIENGVKFKIVNEVFTNMADGGISNDISSLFKRVKERKYFLSKRKFSKIQINIDCFSFFIRGIIKSITPFWVIKLKNSK